ncbi:SCO7613 C-terminal domain-containing membrane protein [Natronoglycomyces albus]|uniref:Uncharacterized protein n=1 Tax=Natronoglycomyces albus TaxID=2811108 RepID=A0A895XVE9_9ACTN|nr:hypothetical protein [Natronoglycomyces albus]QSB05618.1 hypothetical protein JQS30_01425 [Natronoglycomyces albus]
MTTYACPRCHQASTPAACTHCGRGEEPLLGQLEALDAELKSRQDARKNHYDQLVHLDDELASLRQRHQTLLGQLQELANTHHHTPGKQTSERLPAYNQATSFETPPGAQQQTTHPANAPDMTEPTTPMANPVPTPQPNPPPPHYAPPGHPHANPDATGRTVQVILLSLGGLLTATALAGFTAYAWDSITDAGRFAILLAVTALLFAAPTILTKLKLNATAETFAALASFGLWCSSLAGYYLIFADGRALNAATITALTFITITIIGLYRATATYTAPGWTLLGLAIIAAGYGSTLDNFTGTAATFGAAAAAAASAILIKTRTSAYPRSDQFARRCLAITTIALTMLALANLFYDLNLTDRGLVAAILLTLIAAGVWGCSLYAGRITSTTAAITIYTSVASSAVFALWMVVNTDENTLFAPTIGLGLTVLIGLVHATDESYQKPASLNVTAIAATATLIAAIATIGIVITGGQHLMFAAAATGIVTLLGLGLPENLRHPVKIGAIAAAIGIVTLAAISVLWNAMAYLNHNDDRLISTWEATTAALIAAAGVTFIKKLGAWRIDTTLGAVLIAGIGLLTHFQAHWHFFPSLLALAAIGWALASLATHKQRAPLRFAIGAVLAAVSLLPLISTPSDIAAPTASTLMFTCYAVTAWAIAVASPSKSLRASTWISAPALAVVALISATNANWIDGYTAAYIATLVAALQVLAASLRAQQQSPENICATITAHALAASAILWLYLNPHAAGTPTVALIVYATVLGYLSWTHKTTTARIGYALASAAAVLAAYWHLLVDNAVSGLEFYTVTPALVFLVIGFIVGRSLPHLSSWAVHSPGLLLGMLPTLMVVLAAGIDVGEEGARRIGLGAAAIVVLLAGAAIRSQASLLIGAGVLLVLTLKEMILLADLAPPWLALAIGGAILLTAGATYERQRRYLARFGTYVKELN